MSGCSDEFPTTDVLYDELSDDTPIVVCLCVTGFLTIVCAFIYLGEVMFVRKMYVGNGEQATKVLILLGLYPIVCLTSLVSQAVPTSTILMEMVSGCYSAVCIYTFVSLTISYFGGEDRMLRQLAEDKVRLNVPPCCCCLCCILRPVTLTSKSLHRLKLLCMQSVIVTPVLLMAAAVLWTDGRYDQEVKADSGFPYIAAPLAVSTLLSLYGMIVICRASMDHLRHQNLMVKFVAFQLMLVFSSLQRLIFNILAARGFPGCEGTRDSEVRGLAINSAVLSIEAFLLSLLARKGYRHPISSQVKQNQDAEF